VAEKCGNKRLISNNRARDKDLGGNTQGEEGKKGVFRQKPGKEGQASREVGSGSPRKKKVGRAELKNTRKKDHKKKKKACKKAAPNKGEKDRLSRAKHRWSN